MDDEVAHARVVDARLRLCLPGLVGRPVIGVDADDVDRREIGEREGIRIFQLPAENQMEKLVLFSLIGNSSILVAAIGMRA